MTDTNKLDEFHANEALDRCSIIGGMIDDLLLEHPFIKHNLEVYKLIEKAQVSLGEAYQMIGAKHL